MRRRVVGRSDKDDRFESRRVPVDHPFPHDLRNPVKLAWRECRNGRQSAPRRQTTERGETSGGDLVGKIGRDDRIRTCDPLTPSQVRYQAALHPELLSLRPAEAGHHFEFYADARLLRLAGRAGFRAATRVDATVAFDRTAIDRRAPLTSDGGSRR